MYNDTVTLFCQYKDQRKNITWYPTILRNVNLNKDKAAIIAQYGAESQDNAVLNVRCHITDGKIMVGNKIWLPPKEWDRQTNDLLSSSLTFTDGQEFDFFYEGEWPDENPIGDDEYGIDGFYNYMNRYYDYVFAITSVGGPYSVIPHFEIMGA